jgi:hypothetical protein
MAISTDIERLNYYEGEYLGAVDFAAEQDYQRDMRRRHNVGQHTWGIVSGLELVLTSSGNTSGGTAAQAALYVQPGMAIDGFGREIVVLNQTQITQDSFAAYYNPNPNAVIPMAIWITYTQQLIEPSQDACTSLNTNNPFGRVQETFQIVVTPVGTPPTDDSLTMDGSTIDPAKVMAATPPVTAPDGSVLPPDLSIAYQQFPTDDSGLFWYIPLGQIIWNANSGAISASMDDGRLYSGAVAAHIYAPAGSLIIQDRLSPYPLTDLTQNGVNVEVSGMLTVDRLFTAEQDAWIFEGGHLNFKNASGLDGDTPLWLGRHSNGTGGADLQIHIGDNSDPTNKPQRLTIGSGSAADGSQDQLLMTVSANGNVNILMGPLGFGNQTSQMLNLSGTAFGLGVQPATLFFRSGSDFAWYVGGTYSSKQDDPGSQGSLSMKLDASGDLSVNAALNIDQAGANTGNLNPGLTFGTSGSTGIASNQKGNTNQGGLDFYTNSAAQMSITQQGQVGIGTSSPQQNLSVAGGLNIDQANENNGFMAKTPPDPCLHFGRNSGEGIASKRTSGGNQWGLDFYTGYQSRMSISNQGQVAIGTTSPGYLLDVADRMRVRQGSSSSAGIWFFQNAPAKDQAFVGMAQDTQIGFYGNTGAGWALIMDTTSGNIGVGTTPNPAFKLEVNGAVNFNGNITVNGNRTYIAGLDGAGDHWLMSGGTSEGPDNALGFQPSAQQILIGNSWSVTPGSGTLFVNGAISASGGKGGYVTDRFINADGLTLERGDVVVLHPNAACRFYGLDNRIPFAEVNLTDTLKTHVFAALWMNPHLQLPNFATWT